MIFLLHISIFQVFLSDTILFQSKLVQENTLFRSNTAPCYGPEHCGVQVYVIAMPGQLGHYSSVATGWTYEESCSIPNREQYIFPFSNSPRLALVCTNCCKIVTLGSFLGGITAGV
jgi:hypothetical protein